MAAVLRLLSHLLLLLAPSLRADTPVSSLILEYNRAPNLLGLVARGGEKGKEGGGGKDPQQLSPSSYPKSRPSFSLLSEQQNLELGNKWSLEEEEEEEEKEEEEE